MVPHCPYVYPNSYSLELACLALCLLGLPTALRGDWLGQTRTNIETQKADQNCLKPLFYAMTELLSRAPSGHIGGLSMPAPPISGIGIPAMGILTDWDILQPILRLKNLRVAFILCLEISESLFGTLSPHIGLTHGWFEHPSTAVRPSRHRGTPSGYSDKFGHSGTNTET